MGPHARWSTRTLFSFGGRTLPARRSWIFNPSFLYSSSCVAIVAAAPSLQTCRVSYLDLLLYAVLYVWGSRSQGEHRQLCLFSLAAELGNVAQWSEVFAERSIRVVRSGLALPPPISFRDERASLA